MKALVGFAGIGGVEFGIRATGIEVAQAVEYDAEIAHWHQINHPETHCIIGDITQVPLDAYQAVDIAWFSPSCKMHSQARTNAVTYDEADATSGRAIIPIVRHIRPSAVFIENVPQYAFHPVFREIVAALATMGYIIESRIMDMADYGVPQSRKRLIVQARLDGRIAWPRKQAHHGWYQAIADLLPLAPRRDLPQWLKNRWEPCFDQWFPLLIDGQYAYRRNPNLERTLTVRQRHEATPCIVASDHSHKYIAFTREQGILITPEMGKRLKAFPHVAQLPSIRRLAQQMIGNAVPPYFVQHLMEAAITGPRYWNIGLWASSHNTHQEQLA